MRYLKYSSKIGLYGTIIAIALTALLWAYPNQIILFPALILYPTFIIFGGFPNLEHLKWMPFLAAVTSNFVLYWFVGSLMWLGHRDDRLVWIAPAVVIAFYLLGISILMLGLH